MIGEDLYAMYLDALHEKGEEGQTWFLLSDNERSAWNSIAYDLTGG